MSCNGSMLCHRMDRFNQCRVCHHVEPPEGPASSLHPVVMSNHQRAIVLSDILHLSKCHLDADTAKELSVGLAANTSIQNLNLSKCHLDADTAKELSVGLAANTSIQNLK
ncbi:hypothetical protein LSAT2_025234 [Lamellibrachia satsuma]|nr:hypothetical protein LSAT2_025234 [Lamellibrachia satsuma]